MLRAARAAGCDQDRDEQRKKKGRRRTLPLTTGPSRVITKISPTFERTAATPALPECITEDEDHSRPQRLEWQGVLHKGPHVINTDLRHRAVKLRGRRRLTALLYQDRPE